MIRTLGFIRLLCDAHCISFISAPACYHSRTLTRHYRWQQCRNDLKRGKTRVRMGPTPIPCDFNKNGMDSIRIITQFGSHVDSPRDTSTYTNARVLYFKRINKGNT